MLEIKPSPIHGHGVFTAVPITASAYIGVIGGPLVSEETSHTIRIDDEEQIIIDPTPPFRFINHADDPNCEIIDGVWLQARRDIQAGEELTFHYGPDWSER